MWSRDLTQGKLAESRKVCRGLGVLYISRCSLYSSNNNELSNRVLFKCFTYLLLIGYEPGTQGIILLSHSIVCFSNIVGGTLDWLSLLRASRLYVCRQASTNFSSLGKPFILVSVITFQHSHILVNRLESNKGEITWHDYVISSTPFIRVKIPPYSILNAE